MTRILLIIIAILITSISASAGQQPIPDNGQSTCYGIVAVAGSDPWNAENWIHFDFKTFEMK